MGPCQWLTIGLKSRDTPVILIIFQGNSKGIGYRWLLVGNSLVTDGSFIRRCALASSYSDLYFDLSLYKHPMLNLLLDTARYC